MVTNKSTGALGHSEGPENGHVREETKRACPFPFPEPQGHRVCSAAVVYIAVAFKYLGEGLERWLGPEGHLLFYSGLWLRFLPQQPLRAPQAAVGLTAHPSSQWDVLGPSLIKPCAGIHGGYVFVVVGAMSCRGNGAS